MTITAPGAATARVPALRHAAGVPDTLPGPVVVTGGILAAAAAAGLAALFPVLALGGLAVLAFMTCVWARPTLAAYLLVGITPLTAGIDRGSVIPVLRPSEALAFLLGAALFTRWIARIRTAHMPKLRLERVEWAIIAMALANSVVPIAWMLLRNRTPTADDYLYALVLWKFLAVYLIVRMSVTTDRQIKRCLWISIGAASIVAVIGILQALDLFGVRGMLSKYYVPFGYVGALSKPRGGSTLALPAATADLMIFNLAIVAGFWMRGRQHRPILAGAAVLFVLGALAAGEFSSALGLVVAVVALAVVTRSPDILVRFAPVAVGGIFILWPVVAARLAGFRSVSGLPASWVGRLHNLQNYFWPELLSDWNFLLGVRPAARVPVAYQATGYVWIESGYTWLLWGGGIPLLAAYLFFLYAAGRRGWRTARTGHGAGSVAGIAAFVAVVVCAVLMVFDPHITYRGSGEALFALIALTRWYRTDHPSRPIQAGPGGRRIRWNIMRRSGVRGGDHRSRDEP